MFQSFATTSISTRPLDLNAGTYWVALNFTNTSQFVVWQETVQDTFPPYAAGAPAGTTNFNLSAIQLYLGISDTPLVTAAPEPASFALAGLALAGLAVSIARKSAKPSPAGSPRCTEPQSLLLSNRLL